MVNKIINATEAKTGVNISIEGKYYTVKNNDISKTGKHGASKCRIEALNMIDGSKKIIVVPGHERFEVPTVRKLKAQVLSKSEKGFNVMDLENFENFDIECKDSDLFDSISESDSLEYWDVEGQKIIKRKV